MALGSLGLYLATGAIAGLLAGLLGVGGGVVVVPALAWAFAKMDMAQAARMHLAIGTSLASIVVTGVAAAAAHRRRGAVHTKALAGLTPGLMIGAAVGGLLARKISTAGLRLLFACFLGGVGLRLQWPGTQVEARSARARPLPSSPALAAAGLLIGIFSALVGIGGGTLTVPFLLWRAVPLRQAVGTSAAAAIPIAICGAASFIGSGWGTQGLPPHSTGYVYWPALAGLAPAALLAAPLGARLAHRLPVALIRRSFGALLLLVAGKMLHGYLSA